MKQTIRDEIGRFLHDSSDNRFKEGGGSYFDAPLVGFAAAADPLFQEYKSIVGTFHLTPHEMAQPVTGGSDPWRPRTVICWVLPIAGATCLGNRSETVYPSRAWSRTREHGEACNAALRRHMADFLRGQGYRAVAPQLDPKWREFADTATGIASSWSERHAAYAAGLGTFSLNDGLITSRGIAHRLGSVITDLEVEPSRRSYSDHRQNCLWYRKGTCGACIGRCPVGAITHDGHDKGICRDYVYRAVPDAVAKKYGVTSTGCGLCQTGVPCERRIP